MSGVVKEFLMMTLTSIDVHSEALTLVTKRFR